MKMPDSATFFSKLEGHYNLCKKFILNFQHPITGLLPSSLHKGKLETSPNCGFAWVRDNVYCAISIWALSVSYGRMSDHYEVVFKMQELENATVKIMRSLLYCMMKQVHKVEEFKSTQNIYSSLHAKYNMKNCATSVGDTEWGHLQIDATSLYLLTLAQMITSGMNLIFTLDEVAFVQNLVFYIENSYTIPDYGIFERGDKTNHGLPELNTSSIGMAKAALQALTDFNLFGSNGGANSTIHVQPDNIHKCQAVIESMLPKESMSKEVGASVLSIISYPAFAVEKEELICDTREKIKEKLEGRYGLCRFLRDGHKTAVEDVKRLHYETNELKIFENIESEWPLFFIYLIIDGIFSNNRAEAEKYLEKLKHCIILDSEKCEMIPELYYVPLNQVEAEYANPGSQTRLPGDHLPHLWSESLFILASLLFDGIISPGDIDPLNRRYSTQPKPEVVIQILLVTQDEEAHNMLEKLGIASHKFEGDPELSVLPASYLNSIYEKLGACEKLGLSGRPHRDVGTVSTSILYQFNNRFCIFNPQFMDTSLFYFTFDHQLLVDNLKGEMDYLRANWKMEGRPTIVLSISSLLLENSTESVVGQFIQKLKTGHYLGIRIRLGMLNDFIGTSCINRWDFLQEDEIHELLDNFCLLVRKRQRRFSGVFRRSTSKLESSTSGEPTKKGVFDSKMRQSTLLSNKMVSSQPSNDGIPTPGQFLWHNTSKRSVSILNLTEQLGQTTLSTETLLKTLEAADDIYEQALCLYELHTIEGINFEVILNNGINFGSIGSLLRDLYSVAGTHHLWMLVRQTAGYLRKQADGLAQACTDLLVRQKQFSVGYSDHQEDVISMPMSPGDLKELIYKCYEPDLTGAVLTQEIMVYLSIFIRTEPQLFNHMLRLRLGLIIEVAAAEFTREANLSTQEGADEFLNLCPFTLKALIHHIVSGKEFKLTKTNDSYFIEDGGSRISKIKLTSRTNSLKSIDEDSQSEQIPKIATPPPEKERRGFWYRRRCLDGSLNRIPEGFFSNIWRVLNSCDGISLNGYVLGKVIVEEMTSNELKFALKIESALNQLTEPEYRQIMIETITVFGQLILCNPYPVHNHIIVQLDRVIDEANRQFLENQQSVHGDAITCCAGKPEHERECPKIHKVCKFFYDIAPSGEFGTMNFIAKSLLKIMISMVPNIDLKGTCHIS